MTKTCAKCKRELPVASFRSHKGHGDGYDSRCKDCMRRDQAAKKQLTTPAVADIDPRKGKEWDAYCKPYIILRDHQKVCLHGCDADEDLVEAAVEAYEGFYDAYAVNLDGLPPHAKGWVRVALANRRLLLNVPPRHAKTTVMSEWFVIWQLACDRDTQVIIISKTVTLGELLSRYIADQFTSNEKLIAAFGIFRPRDLTRPWREAKGELEVQDKDLTRRHGLSIQVRGSGQAILGMEADWVVADDITDRRVARSETDRATEWDFFLGDVLTRLAPDGKAFCIGQRVHAEDLYGRLAKLVDEHGTPTWTQVKTPAILDEEAGLTLWPEVWDYPRLVERRKAVSTPLFNCMFQQAPEHAGEFVPAWWLEGVGDSDHPGCYDRKRSVGEGWQPTTYEQGIFPVTRVISLDPSPTMFAGITVADIIWMPRAHYFWCAIVDVVRDKMGQNKMVQTMHAMTQRYRPQVCIFETNSAKWLHEDPAWNRVQAMFPVGSVIGQNTTKWNKDDTALGIWSLAADFEAGRISIPWQTPDDRTRMEPLVDEVLAYPNGTSDDVLMSLWFIKNNYKQLIPRGLIPTRFQQSKLSSKYNVDRAARRWANHKKGSRVHAS